MGVEADRMPGEQLPDGVQAFIHPATARSRVHATGLDLVAVIAADADPDLGFITFRCSAADAIKGKPAPDVYLAAARGLGIVPVHCLAVEDSVSGVTAAKSAGMRCIAVPDPQLVADPRFGEADLVLSSLTDLDESALYAIGARPGRADKKLVELGGCQRRQGKADTTSRWLFWAIDTAPPAG